MHSTSLPSIAKKAKVYGNQDGTGAGDVDAGTTRVLGHTARPVSIYDNFGIYYIEIRPFISKNIVHINDGYNININK